MVQVRLIDQYVAVPFIIEPDIGPGLRRIQRPAVHRDTNLVGLPVLNRHHNIRLNSCERDADVVLVIFGLTSVNYLFETVHPQPFQVEEVVNMVAGVGIVELLVRRLIELLVSDIRRGITPGQRVVVAIETRI